MVLAPTRELALQITRVIAALGRHMAGLEVLACVGGTDIRDTITKLHSRVVHVVVGTPGRIIDLIGRTRRHLHLQHLRLFVLDEADEMLRR